MKIGDKVRWTSQAGGREKEKEGTIVEVVPPGMWPFENIHGSGQGKSFTRDQESYVVNVDGKMYWPRSSKTGKSKLLLVYIAD